MRPRRTLPKIALVAAATLVSATAVAGQIGAGDKKPLGRLPQLRLDAPGSGKLALLDAFREAEIEQPGPVRLYVGGRWGRWEQAPWMELAWALPHATPALALTQPGEERWAPADSAWSFAAPAAPVEMEFSSPLARSVAAGIDFDALWSLPAPGANAPPKPRTCWRRPVTFVRYGAESDTFALVGCDGSVAPEALDRLSLMARPPEVPRPGELLPDEPDDEAWARGEWVDSVRPVHPRLVWLLQRIADGFPRRTIYVFSGYRPKGSSAKSQHSMHGEARAMDISVYGVRNEDLFRYCRTLDDVGCGYYPNSKFVHVDVRRPKTGHAFWVDASGPGQPSRYVDSWPGVVESGAMVWDKKAREQASATAAEPPDAGAASEAPEPAVQP